MTTIDIINSARQVYAGSLRDQRPAARDALDMHAQDMAEKLVPFPKPCERRTPVVILREIGRVQSELMQVAIDGGDVTFGSELLRELAIELAGARR